MMRNSWNLCSNPGMGAEWQNQAVSTRENPASLLWEKWEYSIHTAQHWGWQLFRKPLPLKWYFCAFWRETSSVSIVGASWATNPSLRPPQSSLLIRISNILLQQHQNKSLYKKWDERGEIKLHFSCREVLSQPEVWWGGRKCQLRAVICSLSWAVVSSDA